MSFAERRLGQIVTLQRGFDITKSEQTAGEVPIVSSSGIASFHGVSKVKGPGVVIGRKGSLGTVHYVEQDHWPHDTTLWVKDYQGNDRRFVSYFLKTLRLENFDTGSSNPTLNRNHAHKIKVLCPEPPVQRKIAAILSAYDDLIATNQRRIGLLESLTEEIYREWFVRMRFPGHENVSRRKGVPTSWFEIELREVARECGRATKPGPHLEGRNYLPLELLDSRRMVPSEHFDWSEAHSSLVTFEKGSFLFGAMRPYQHKVAVAPFNGITRSTCFVIQPQQAHFYSFLFLTLFQRSTVDYASLICNGSDRPYVVWAKGLERMRLWMPEDDLVRRFDGVVRPIIDRLCSMYFELRTLRCARDALLPRLLSGKLKVDHLDIQFPPSMREKVTS